MKAHRFIAEKPDLPPKERAAEVEKSDWDPSRRWRPVPDLSDHPDRIEQAGDAVLAQTGDVMDSVQRLRNEAAETGALTTNDAQMVTVSDDDTPCGGPQAEGAQAAHHAPKVSRPTGGSPKAVRKAPQRSSFFEMHGGAGIGRRRPAIAVTPAGTGAPRMNRFALPALLLAPAVAQADPATYYGSPEAAVAAIGAAPEAGDAAALLAVFGAENEDVAFSGNDARDREVWSRFLDA